MCMFTTYLKYTLNYICVIENMEKWRRKQQRDLRQIYVVLLFIVKIC
jgi:hypothetical protein